MNDEWGYVAISRPYAGKYRKWLQVYFYKHWPLKDAVIEGSLRNKSQQYSSCWGFLRQEHVGCEQRCNGRLLPREAAMAHIFGHFCRHTARQWIGREKQLSAVDCSRRPQAITFAWARKPLQHGRHNVWKSAGAYVCLRRHARCVIASSPVVALRILNCFSWPMHPPYNIRVLYNKCYYTFVRGKSKMLHFHVFYAHIFQTFI